MTQTNSPSGRTGDDARRLPKQIMAWHSSPNLDHMGTWSTTRYPDDAVAYAPVDDAMREAVGLARALHRKHYQDDAPQWEPLDTVTGVISQIDNMTAGMSDEITRLTALLATARRDAWEEAAMVAYEHFPATQDMESTKVCNALEDVAAAIRALITQEEPTT